MHRLLQMHTHVSNSDGPVAILRQSLVRICEGNHCSAIILDYLYEKALLLREDRDNREPSPYVSTSLGFLKEMMSSLFEKDIITSSLAQLAQMGYIDFNDATINRLDEEVYYKFPVNIIAVNDVLVILNHEEAQLEEKKIPPLVEIQPAVPQQIIRVSSSERNIRTEGKRVAFHRRRAEVIALPATLTLEQWIATLDHFNWHCAYCKVEPYRVFEHYVPLFHGGGTTPQNCVPACSRCNSIKTDAHPTIFESRFPKETIEQVKSYLAEQLESEVGYAN